MSLRKLLSILILTAMSSITFSASAKSHCTAYIYDIEVTTQGVDVRTSNGSWNKFYIDFQDRNFKPFLEKLAIARDNSKLVKMYIIEEYDGDDGVRCSDSMDNYIDTVILIN